MPNATYRFEQFVLDGARAALLTVDGVEIPLRAKSFDLLRLFVANAGRLLCREEIMRAVWRGLVVTDDSLTQCVRDIRRVLNDEEARLLRTVKGRGYIFVAEVRRTAPALRLNRGTAVPPSESHAGPVVWQETRAGGALRGWAMARILTLGRYDAGPRWRRSDER